MSNFNSLRRSEIKIKLSSPSIENKNKLIMYCNEEKQKL